jgi:hypothetical protein
MIPIACFELLTHHRALQDVNWCNLYHVPEKPEKPEKPTVDCLARCAPGSPFPSCRDPVYVERFLATRVEIMLRRPKVRVWIAAAVAVSVAVAIVQITVARDLRHGLPSAVGAVARVSFIPFWLSYTGGAWVTLGFRRFAVIRDHARELGLAFAAAIAVHIALIGWQTLLGDPPGRGIVIIFGAAALLTLVLSVVSIPILSKRLPRVALARFRYCATTYIALVYLRDFAIHPQPAVLYYWIAYAAFAALDVLGLAVRALAWVRGVWEPRRSSAPAR